MTIEDDHRITIRSFNPYRSRFPNRRVVSRTGLLLQKRLRHMGYQVDIDPDDGSEINYLNQSGVEEFLSNPLWLLLAGIPLSLVTAILSNIITKAFAGKWPNAKTSVLLELDERGQRLHYDHSGKPLSESQLAGFLEALREREQSYRNSSVDAPPDARFPYPIFEEHGGEVVGWARVWEDEKGLRVNAIVTNDDTWMRVKEGILNGYSIGGLVRRASCSICGGSFIHCSHPTGDPHEPSSTAAIEEMDLAEVSLVRNPLQPLASIEIRRAPE